MAGESTTRARTTGEPPAPYPPRKPRQSRPGQAGVGAGRATPGIAGLPDLYGDLQENPHHLKEIDFGKLALQAMMNRPATVDTDDGGAHEKKMRERQRVDMEEGRRMQSAEAEEAFRKLEAARVRRREEEQERERELNRRDSIELASDAVKGLAQKTGAKGIQAIGALFGAGGGKGKGVSMGAPGDGKDEVFRLEEDLNMETMLQLKLSFDKADKDHGGGLDVREFVEAFGESVPGASEGDKKKSVEKLFMKIDANSDGSITWDEFSTYMMLENQGSARLRETELSLEFVRMDMPPPNDSDVHRDSILGITKIPSQIGLHDKYVTVSKDGSVKFWNAKDFSLIKVVSEGSGWITDVKLLPKTQRMVTGSFKRVLKLYDTQHSLGEVIGSKDMEHAPLCIDAFYSDRYRREFIVVGDVCGLVHMFFLDDRGIAMDDKSIGDKYFFSSMARISLTKKYRVPREVSHEQKWISSVLFLPGIDCIVATVMDGSVYLLEFATDTGLKIKKEYRGHNKGVFCSAWSNHFNFLATGGMDRSVFLWTPYNSSPLSALVGHSASVCSLVINEKDGQLISLSTDKNIRVWDIRSHRCLQSFFDTVKYRPEDTLTTLYYDGARRTLITGNTSLKCWPLRSIISTGASAHGMPVSCSAYNAQFGEIVTGDHEGVVCVWEAATGSMRFRFPDAHGENKITAMSFDANQRRLITGSDAGDLRVWNYSAGNLLRICEPLGGKSKGIAGQDDFVAKEVTGILGSSGSYSGRFFVSVGWDHKVTFYEDVPVSQSKVIQPMRHLAGHKSDILSLAQGPHSLLATSGDDGEVIVWNVDSGMLKNRLSVKDRGSQKTERVLVADERACECIKFLPSTSKGTPSAVLAAVYADRFLRLWNTALGALSLEFHTGHRAGETVTTLAVACDEAAGTGGSRRSYTLVTGDSKGFVKTWQLANFNPTKTYTREQVDDMVTETGFWRAHTKAVTSLHVVQHAGQTFVVTTGYDCMATMWTDTGVHVGDFGKDTWDLSDHLTWRSREPQAVDPVENADGAINPTPEISAWVVHATAAERQAFAEKETNRPSASGGSHYDDDAFRRHRKARPDHQNAHRVFIVEKDRFDRDLNFPYTGGRPNSSFAHLLHIQRPAAIAERPKTSAQLLEAERRGGGRGRGHGGRPLGSRGSQRAKTPVTPATPAMGYENRSRAIISRLPDILARRTGARQNSAVGLEGPSRRVQTAGGVLQSLAGAGRDRQRSTGLGIL